MDEDGSDEPRQARWSSRPPKAIIIQMAALTREQFIDQVLKTVPEKFPLVKLARGEGPFSMRVNGHVVSLESIYRLALLRPEEMRHNIERWIVELLRAAEGTPDRTGTFEQLKDRILPMILPDRGGDDRSAAPSPSRWSRGCTSPTPSTATARSPTSPRRTSRRGRCRWTTSTTRRWRTWWAAASR